MVSLFQGMARITFTLLLLYLTFSFYIHRHPGMRWHIPGVTPPKRKHDEQISVSHDGSRCFSERWRFTDDGSKRDCLEFETVTNTMTCSVWQKHGKDDVITCLVNSNSQGSDYTSGIYSNQDEECILHSACPCEEGEASIRLHLDMRVSIIY